MTKAEEIAEQTLRRIQEIPDDSCVVCHWPLAKTLEEGCIPGNCSYRPVEHSGEWTAIHRRRNWLENIAAALEKFGAEERAHAFDGLKPHSCDGSVQKERERCATILDRLAQELAEADPIELPDGYYQAHEAVALGAARIREGRESTQLPEPCPGSPPSPDAPAAAK